MSICNHKHPQSLVGVEWGDNCPYCKIDALKVELDEQIERVQDLKHQLSQYIEIIETMKNRIQFQADDAVKVFLAHKAELAEVHEELADVRFQLAGESRAKRNYKFQWSVGFAERKLLSEQLAKARAEVERLTQEKAANE